VSKRSSRVPAVAHNVGDVAYRATSHYLAGSGLSPSTERVYLRQCAAYIQWVTSKASRYPNAFVDTGGAETAVTAWRTHLIRSGAAPSSINLALIAATLLYEHDFGLTIEVGRVVPLERTGTNSLSLEEQRRVERASVRRGVRDAAIIAVLLYAGATPKECACLRVEDVCLAEGPGGVHLRGNSGEIRFVPMPAIPRRRLSAWMQQCNEMGPLWTNERASPSWRGGGRRSMSADRITRVVSSIGQDAGIPHLRPYQLRHTYGVRLAEKGADVALIQERLGLQSGRAAARYLAT